MKILCVGITTVQLQIVKYVDLISPKPGDKTVQI